MGGLQGQVRRGRPDRLPASPGGRPRPGGAPPGARRGGAGGGNTSTTSFAPETVGPPPRPPPSAHSGDTRGERSSRALRPGTRHWAGWLPLTCARRREAPLTRDSGAARGADASPRSPGFAHDTRNRSGRNRSCRPPAAPRPPRCRRGRRPGEQLRWRHTGGWAGGSTIAPGRGVDGRAAGGRRGVAPLACARPARRRPGVVPCGAWRRSSGAPCGAEPVRLGRGAG